MKITNGEENKFNHCIPPNAGPAGQAALNEVRLENMTRLKCPLSTANLMKTLTLLIPSILTAFSRVWLICGALLVQYQYTGRKWR